MRETVSAQCLILDTPAQPPGWRWDPLAGLTCTTDSPQQDKPFALDVENTIWPQPTDQASHPTRSVDSEESLRMASTSFARVVAEALDGRRRLTQLESWFDPDSLTVLSARLAKLQGTRVRLASVRCQPMSAFSAEVSLRLTTPTIDYAAALRVTHCGDKWACTDLVMG